jgi:hypothetical protein
MSIVLCVFGDLMLISELGNAGQRKCRVDVVDRATLFRQSHVRL